MGFDTVDVNVGSLELPEESLLRFVRLIKSGGLKVKPLFAVKFNKSDLPVFGDRAFGAYIVPTSRSSGMCGFSVLAKCHWHSIMVTFFSLHSTVLRYALVFMK